MHAARLVAVVMLAVVWAGASRSAVAEELAVLVVEYGQGVSPLLEATVRRAAGATGEHQPLEAGVAAARVAERFGVAAGVDRAWVEAEAERGEEAYYAMSYADAAAVFESTEWLQAQAALVDLAEDPTLAEAVRRGLMARGRAYYYAEDRAATEAAIRDAVALFPEWIPETDWYQPEYVVRYTEVRHDVLREAGELQLAAPAGDCEFTVNGAVLGRGSVASTATVSEALAVRVTCGATASRVHLLRAGRAFVDPRFDAAFDPSARQLTLSPEAADDAAVLAAMGRAYADVVGVDRVILAGVLASGQLQLVEVAAGETTPRSAVRAHPDAEGTFDVPTALSALLGGARSTSVSVADVDDQRLVFPRLAGSEEAPSSGPGVATWVAFGVGGAGLILGTVFAIVEGGAYDDFEACRKDPVCSTGSELGGLEDDRDSAALLATIGFGVGLAGVVTGVVLWVVQSGSESAPAAAADGGAPSAGWQPTVGGAVTGDGGFLELGWRF